MRQNKGFTLIELIVFVLLLVVATGMVIPAAGQVVARYRLDTAARQMAAEIREVQQWAITRQDTYVLTFPLEQNYYYLPLADNKLVKRKVDLPPDVLITGVTYSEGKLRFDAKGSPNLGGHINIANGRESREISINPVTGRVKIYKGNR